MFLQDARYGQEPLRDCDCNVVLAEGGQMIAMVFLHCGCEISMRISITDCRLTFEIDVSVSVQIDVAQNVLQISVTHLKDRESIQR